MSREIRGVKTSGNVVCIATLERLYLFDIITTQLIEMYHTYTNPRGLVCIISHPNVIVAFPDKQKGWIRLNNFQYDRSRVIHAHKTAVAAIALSNDGRLLASASDKGTLIRVFDT